MLKLFHQGKIASAISIFLICMNTNSSDQKFIDDPFGASMQQQQALLFIEGNMLRNIDYDDPMEDLAAEIIFRYK